jgi:starch synthase
MKLKVLFVAAECSPLVRVGELADLIGSLAKELDKSGVEVRVALPGYKGINGAKTLPGTDIPLFLIEHETYFNSSREPYLGEDDDLERFAYFSREVGRCLNEWAFKPDIIHAYDWPTSLVPAIIRRSGFPSATVLTINDLAVLGTSPNNALFPAGLSEEELRSLEWDFQDRGIDVLLQGIINADVINTVSPTYAKEVTTPEFGEGFQDILKVREERLFGVLSGLDYSSHDPARDHSLFQNYSLSNFEEGKMANKKSLQKELGLGANGEVALVGFAAPLVDQKGLSLVSEGFDRMMRLPLQFVLVGEGDGRYGRRFNELSREYPSKFSAQLVSDEGLARKLYAAADLLLVPSRFEPYGLVPMIAARYGALPLVRATGGLRDSVVDGEDGFVFEKYEVGQMLTTLRRALRTFGTPSWNRMVEKAMQKDSSWERAAGNYLSLYERALEFAKNK